MRAKYYALMLRQMNVKKSFVFFFSFIVIFLLIICFFNKKIRPTIKKICENNAQNIAIKASNKAINDNMDKISYSDLIITNNDNNGKVTSLIANSVEINKLNNKITADIEKNLKDNKENDIVIPVGIIFNENILSGYGPHIRLKTYPVGDIRTELKSSFESAGINQIKHSLILEITTEVKVIAPFVSEKQEYKNSVVIAETVIVSDIPSSYYNISGLDKTNGITTIPNMSDSN